MEITREENKHPDMVIKQAIFDDLINASIELFREISSKSKQDLTVTQAEADWANAFLAYANELTIKLKENSK